MTITAGTASPIRVLSAAQLENTGGTCSKCHMRADSHEWVRLNVITQQTIDCNRS